MRLLSIIAAALICVGFAAVYGLFAVCYGCSEHYSEWGGGMKQFFGSICHLSLLVAAYLVARADGYISAKEVGLPMYVNFALWVAFFMLIVVYEITGSVKKKDGQ